MNYIIHHPENQGKPDLRGGASKDMIVFRFDETLEGMKEIIKRLPASRMKNFGLSTGTLYVSEDGWRLVWCQPRNHEDSSA